MGTTYATKQDLQESFQNFQLSLDASIRNIVGEIVGEATREILEVVDVRFNRVEERFDRVELRLDRVESRLDKVEDRLTSVETEVKIIGHKLDATIERVDRHDSVIGYNLQTNQLKQLPA
jgi:uncharacterized protein with HEPN domain